MSSWLNQRVAETALAAERSKWAYAWLRWCAAALALIAGLGVVDALWRGHDTGTRLLLSGTGGVCLVLLAWHCFHPLRGARLAELDVARQIDRFYPQLGNRLSSAVAFASEAALDPVAGSAELRRHVVAEAEALAKGLDFDAVLDRTSVAKARRVATITTVAIAMLVFLAPQSSATAIKRLALPLARIEWPRQYELKWLEAPDCVAEGQDLELVLGGRLPDAVQLQIAYPGEGRTETRAMQSAEGKMTYRLANVTSPLRYRAAGGDDDHLPWITLEVVEPPELLELVTTVKPPAYTGWPAQTGGRSIRLLAGSSVVASGRFDRPISGVRFVPENLEQPAVTGIVNGEGTSFQAPGSESSDFIVGDSNRWRLEVEDAQGIASRQAGAIEFQVLPDQPPKLTWDWPLAGAYLTPDARLGLLGRATDDLGIERIALEVSREEGSDGERKSIELYRNDQREALVPSIEQMAAGTGRTIDYRWSVAETLPVKPGDVLLIRLSAADFLRQTSKTPIRRLLVISKEAFEEQVRQRQANILDQLTSVAKLARDARTATRDLEVRWKETGSRTATDAARLQTAEFNQRHVFQMLNDPATGIKTQAEQLLNELVDNQLAGIRLARQLKELRAATNHIASDLLPPIAASLSAAGKELQAADASVVAPLALIVAAGKAQDEVINTIDAILSRLNEWDTHNRLARELSRIREEQQKLHEETEQLQLRVAAASGDELPEQIAQCKQFGQQQFDLTRQLDRMLLRVAALRNKLVDSNANEPGSAATLLTDAIAAAERTGVSSLMQEAARTLSHGRPGSAVAAQSRALEGLDAMLNALAGRPDQELKHRIAQLEALSSQLAALIERQNRERQAADQAVKEGNADQQRSLLSRIARAEERIGREVKELQEKLEKLHSLPAASGAEKTAQELASAATAGKQGAAEDTQQAAREAHALLEQTRRELHTDLRQAQADLVQEEMARLEKFVGEVVARQQTLLDETKRLEAARNSAGGEWSREQLALVQVAASNEQALARETNQLAQSLVSPAFGLTLQGASQEMERAAARLGANDAGTATQQSQSAALKRLAQLQQVLEEHEAEAPPGEDPPGDQGNADQPPNAQSLNELKLLLLLQQEVNRRTAEVAQQRDKEEEMTAELVRQLTELAEEQGRIVAIMQGLLTRSSGDADSKDLSPVPGVRNNEP